MSKEAPLISVSNLSIGYGDYVLMKDISFSVSRGEIFFIMGGSGCGKSTLLHVLTGLIPPLSGKISINGADFSKVYQSGALFSSMTLSENVALPLQQYTDYSPGLIKELTSLKLALVGLAGFEDFYPSEISGGMCKRAGLARALALDPEILYCDEPSAGLDPVSSRLLDDLILDLNHSLGTTFVIVSHELASIFNIGTDSIFLDGDTKSIMGRGKPGDLLRNPPNDVVRRFLTRGAKK